MKISLMLVLLTGCSMAPVPMMVEDAAPVDHPDALSTPDGGIDEDAGRDTGELQDTGVDASVEQPDARDEDATLTPWDAGSDAGGTDAGHDAGTDAGTDAGPPPRVRGAIVKLGAFVDGTCALDDLNQMWCWGNGTTRPVFVTMASALEGNCGVTADGVYCAWMTPMARTTSALVPGARSFVHTDGTLEDFSSSTLTWSPPSPIVTLPTTNCALLSSGHAWCWDLRTGGAPSAWTLESFVDRGAATDVARAGSFYDISYRACFMRASGLACETTRSTISSELLRRGIEVEAGGGRMCAIVEVDWSTHPRGVYCTSDTGPNIDRAFPTLFDPLPASDAVGEYTSILGTQLRLGLSHACILRAGEVLCWGSNTQGQLGNGTRTATRTPTAVVW